MKQALFVASDRDVTREPAAALMGLGPRHNPLPRSAPNVGWGASRAHSLLEARTLMEFVPHPFDLIAVAPKLPDGSGLELISACKREGRLSPPVLLMTQRGRDHHIRRVAALRHHVAGFVNLPPHPDDLRQQLEEASQPRRVLFVSGKHPDDEPFILALKQANYDLRVISLPKETDILTRDFAPHAVVLSLHHPHSLRLCALLKRSPTPPSVLMLGSVDTLANTEDDDNRFRADDYLATPCLPSLVTDRVAALVGWGAHPGGAHAQRRHPSSLSDPSTPSPEEAAYGLFTLASTPQRDSSIPMLSARRSGRRVPCSAEVIISHEHRMSSLLAYALDLSTGGLFMGCTEPLPLDSRIRLSFPLFDPHAPVEVVARVVWLTEGVSAPYGIGAEFEPSPAGHQPDGLRQVVEYVHLVSRVLYQPD